MNFLQHAKIITSVENLICNFFIDNGFNTEFTSDSIFLHSLKPNFCNYEMTADIVLSTSNTRIKVSFSYLRLFLSRSNLLQGDFLNISVTCYN